MQNNILELILTSKNKTIEMKKNAEFRVLTIAGLESSEYNISSINSNQDGSIITHRKIEPREITITGDVKKNENEELNRKKLISFFNPKIDGVLRVNRNGAEKKIAYSVSSFRFTNKKMNEWLQFEVVLECVSPYFESIDNFGKNIALITKQFAFPLAICPKKIMGYKTYNNNVLLLNDGDCETGCEIRIKAAGGDVTNPKVTLNDQFVAVNVEMNLGDELVINTNTRRKSVTLNGNNVIQKLDRRSSFFNLGVGNNIMAYESDEGYQDLEIYVYFYKKYLGV